MNLLKLTTVTLIGLTTCSSSATGFVVPMIGQQQVNNRHSGVLQQSSCNEDNLEGALFHHDRRTALSSITTTAAAVVSLAAVPGFMTPTSAQAVADASSSSSPAKKRKATKKKPRVYFKGAITLKDGAEVPPIVGIGSYKALFVSARPKNPTNMPPEVARAARGGVPAVFFAIVPNPKLPGQSFVLTESDITSEGDFGLTSDPYWWAEETEWEISVRVDTDGAVRTFDRDDLVGRTITNQVGESSPDTNVIVAVAERGFFGSYFETNKGKTKRSR